MAFSYWLLWRKRLWTFLYIIRWMWARIPGVELLGHRAGMYLALVNKPTCFPKWLPQQHRRILVLLAIANFLFSIRATLVWVGADIALRLCISLMTNGSWTASHMSLCHLDILFCEMPVHHFCLLSKKGIVCLFINLEESYVYCRYKCLVGIYMWLVFREYL